MMPKVAIIILNWNGWKDTIECLESVYQITYPNYDVIVVDNGSKDDSVRKIKEYCEGKIKVKSKFFEYDPNNKPIYVLEYTREEAEKGGNFRREKYFSKLPSDRKLRLILNEKNYGFAEGNNIGIRYALKALNPDYILLLNNDTVVDRNFLTELVKVAESDERIGIAGPKIYYYGYRGRTDVINFAGGKLSIWRGQTSHIGIKEIDKGQYDKIREVDYVEGSCLLIKTNTLSKVGLLDPNYFVYWEENDLCIRCRRVGYRVIYVPKAKIWHKISSSSGKVSFYRIYYLTRNRFLFMKKYSTKAQLLLSLFYFFGFEFWIRSSIYILYYLSVRAFIYFLKGVLDGFKILIKNL